MSEFISLQTISDLTTLLPEYEVAHPLLALVNFDKYRALIAEGTKVTLGFYGILLADGCQHRLWYGHKDYDFSAGSMLCFMPGQTLTIGTEDGEGNKADSWGLFFHPDLIRRFPLGKNIHSYTFFEYETNEALHLSSTERSMLRNILEQIRGELAHGIDKHTQTLLISNIELMLNYCSRYYERQFITRSSVEGDLYVRFRAALQSYMESEDLQAKGLPTVAELASRVCLSPSYMSDQIKHETGLSPIEHIHHYIIEEAKMRLLSSDVSVSALAYSLGFEYPQYFSRLFKAKTGQTPQQYRMSIA